MANAVKNDTIYNDRILRVVAVSPAGKSIYDFEDVPELIEGLRDAIKAHRSLYQDGKILHRDISDGNVILTEPKISGHRGMLIDLDIAQETERPSSGSPSRTAAVQFLAIEVLQGGSQTYRHDLESFLYLLIWVCIRAGVDITSASKDLKKESMIRRWYSESYEAMAQAKLGDMTITGAERILREFPVDFDCIKHLCRRIRGILFKDAVVIDTPSDSNAVYNQIIMAFDEELAEVRRLSPGPVPNRGSRTNKNPTWGTLRPQEGDNPGRSQEEGRYDLRRVKRVWYREDAV